MLFRFVVVTFPVFLGMQLGAMEAPQPAQPKFKIEEKTIKEAEKYSNIQPNDLTKLSPNLKQQVVLLREAVKERNLKRISVLLNRNPHVAKIGYPLAALYLGIDRTKKGPMENEDQTQMMLAWDNLTTKGANKKKPIFKQVTKNNLTFIMESSADQEALWALQWIPDVWDLVSSNKPFLITNTDYPHIGTLEPSVKDAYIKEYQDYVDLK